MVARNVPDNFLVAFSFAGDERDVVCAIAEAVEARLGRGTVFYDDWFEYYIAGDDADLRLQNIYLKHADLVVCCVSQRYGTKPWTRAEHRAIRALQMRSDQHVNEHDPSRILPLRVGDGDVEGILFNSIVPDARNRPVSETVELIINRLRLIVGDVALATNAPPSGGYRPGVAPPICNLPDRNPQFTGRQVVIDSIRATLSETARAGVLTQAIYGHPGIGKTQLALEYAHRYAHDFDLIWWIDAETATAIPASLSALGDALWRRDRRDTEPVDLQRTVEAVLDDLSRRGSWLLIFDHAQDLDEIASFLPTKGGGQILITSHSPNWQGRVPSPLKVDILPPAQAIEFLLHRTGSTDQNSARLLAEKLGNLPLALEQAAAYMSRTGKPLADYCSLFRSRRAELLSRGQPIGYAGTVDTTVRLAVDRLVDYPAARLLFTWCAFMAADKIPLDLLTATKVLDALPVEMRRIAEDELERDDAVAVLYGSSLVAPSVGALSVHRLVQTVIRAHLSPDEHKAWAELTVRLLREAFPSTIDDLAAPSNWLRCEQLLPHIYSAAARSEEARVSGAETAALLMHLGSYLQHRGEYTEAANLFERALTLAEGAHGPDDLEVAHVLNALGYVRRARGDLNGARMAHERALGIITATLPSDHAEVGSTLNSLGRVLYEQKDLTGARANLERALTIIRAIAPGQPEEASILNNMGRVFYARDDFAAALAAHEQALAIKVAAPAFGPDHPSVGATLASLGRVLLAQRQLDAARVALERARTIQETVLGEHPDLVTTVEDLIAVLEALGHHGEAESARESAQAISKALADRPRRHPLLID